MQRHADMNNELARRIVEINIAECEQGDSFTHWITQASDEVITREARGRLNNEICDYVRGLLQKIGDLEEIVARNEASEVGGGVERKR